MTGDIDEYAIARLTRNRSVVSLFPIKGSCCFIEQENVPSLFSSAWFKEQIRE